MADPEVGTPTDRASGRVCAGSIYAIEGGDKNSGRCKHDAVAGPSGAGTSSKNAGETSISLHSTDEHTSDSQDSQAVLARLASENCADGLAGETKEIGESRDDTAPVVFSGRGALRDGIKRDGPWASVDLKGVGGEMDIGIGRDIVGRASSNLRSCRRSPKIYTIRQI